MSLAYRVYGLRVLADSQIPGLLPWDEPGCVDVRVGLNRLPSWWQEDFRDTGEIWYRSPDVEDGLSRLTIWKLHQLGWYHFCYHDGTEFLIDPLGGEVWCRWPPSATVEDSATYLLGPVFGYILRMRGICCLHASAVDIGHKAIALAGPPRAGKSSTAAAFAKLGYPVISDDIVALTEQAGILLVHPGYPRVCVWPDIAASLYGSPQQLPRITPDGGASDWWDKRYLDLTSSHYHFQRQSLPLSAIYLLDERSGTPTRIESIPASSALPKLAANTYMNYLLDRSMRSKEFNDLARVVSTVPVRRIHPNSDPESLPRMCEAILEDHATLAGACDEQRAPVLS